MKPAPPVIRTLILHPSTRHTVHDGPHVPVGLPELRIQLFQIGYQPRDAHPAGDERAAARPELAAELWAVDQELQRARERGRVAAVDRDAALADGESVA